MSASAYLSRYRRSRIETLPWSVVVFGLLTIVLYVATGGHHLSARQNELERGVSPLQRILSVRSGGYPDGFCRGNSTAFLKNRPALALLIPGVTFSFVGLAIVTDHYFVPSLERICERLQLSEDVAGATFMAAGSSAPELFTSIMSVFITEDDVGIGTIVGSAVFNILVIIGLSGALAGQVLDLDWRPLMRDSFFYVMSIVLLIVFVLGSTRGIADWWEGLILMAGYALYILFMKFGNRKYFALTEKFVRSTATGTQDVLSSMENGESSQQVSGAQDGIANLISNRYSSEGLGSSERRKYSELTPRSKLRSYSLAVIATQRLAAASSAGSKSTADATSEGHRASDEQAVPKRFLGVELPKSKMEWISFPLAFPWKLAFRWTVIDCSQDKYAKWWLQTFIAAILWIMGITYIMVEAARLAGCLIGIPSSVMGLTVLAAGTSVPDALASVAVARNGQGNMAVSNAIGSNVFDILLGLGLPWFIGGLAKRAGQTITIEPIGLVVIPLAILFAIIIALIVVLILLRWKLSPLVGYILFALYAAFVTYQLLDVFVFKIGA